MYIFDSEPDKLGSLPEASRTNSTPDNFVFHTVIKYELKIFSADFRSQLFYLYSRAGEPGVFGSLEPEPVEKETRSRSRLDKMLGAGDAK